VFTKPVAGKRADRRSGQAARNLPQSAPNAAAAGKQQAVEQAIAQGNGARDGGNYEQALSHYQQVVKDLNPREARAFYGLGNVFADIYCYDSAVEAYLKALELRRNDYPEASVGLGYAFVAKELYDDAWEQFQAAAPKSVAAKIGLSIVYAKKGQYQEAIAQLKQIIEARATNDKDRAVAHVAWGDVHFNQGKWPETITQYKQALQLNPELANAYTSLGAAQMTAAFAKFSAIIPQEVTVQDREELAAAAKQAAGNIEKAMTVRKYNRPDGYLYLGYALMHQARYETAISQIDTYLAKIKALESQLKDTGIVTKCGYGFNRLKADGYSVAGFVYVAASSAEANKQRNAELLNKAAEQYKQAISLKEDAGGARSMLGLIYMRQEKYEDAIKQYEKAIPFQAEVANKAGDYRSIGLAYIQLKRYEEAVKALQDSLRLKPDDPIAHELLASAYEDIASKYLAEGNSEETFKWLKKADEVRTTPATNPHPYYFMGDTYAVRFIQQRNEADFGEAVKWLKKAVAIKPDLAAAHQALGIVYWKHFDAEEALASFNEAAKHDPKAAGNYLDMASVYFDLKRNDEAAIGCLKKAIELNAALPDAYTQLGLVYHHKKDDAEAVKQILKAIEIDPKYLQAYLDLATVYREQKNYPEAVKQINKAIELMPGSFRPYRDLAKVYEAQQRNEDAIRYYEEALRNLKPDVPWVRAIFRCRIERLRGRYAEAVGCFQQVTNADDPGLTSYEIGLTYVASNDKRAALEQYQRLVQLKSSWAEELHTKISEMK
jgi:tetratricopeptide (TPR) repeat protein